MQINCCTRPVLLPPFLTSFETRPSVLPHPSFPSGSLFKPPCLLSLLLHVLPPLILISHSATFRFSALFSGPHPWEEGKKQPIFSLSSCIPVPILFSPSAETVPRSSASPGECCAVRTAYSRQRSRCGGGQSEPSNACSEVKLLWLC